MEAHMSTRKYSAAARDAMVRNAAKARKALAAKRKRGEPIGKEKKEPKADKWNVVPLDAVSGPPPAPVVRRSKPKPAPEAARATTEMDALGELIVSTWIAAMRRSGGKR